MNEWVSFFIEHAYKPLNRLMCMKKVLISYGDHNYEESLERIKREATSLGIFDEIFLYTDKMLPANFSSYTKQYSRGGDIGCGNLGLFTIR